MSRRRVYAAQRADAHNATVTWSPITDFKSNTSNDNVGGSIKTRSMVKDRSGCCTRPCATINNVFNIVQGEEFDLTIVQDNTTSGFVDGPTCVRMGTSNCINGHYEPYCHFGLVNLSNQATYKGDIVVAIEIWDFANEYPDLTIYVANPNGANRLANIANYAITINGISVTPNATNAPQNPSYSDTFSAGNFGGGLDPSLVGQDYTVFVYSNPAISQLFEGTPVGDVRKLRMKFN